MTYSWRIQTRHTWGGHYQTFDNNYILHDDHGNQVARVVLQIANQPHAGEWHVVLNRSRTNGMGYTEFYTPSLTEAKRLIAEIVVEARNAREIKDKNSREPLEIPD